MVFKKIFGFIPVPIFYTENLIKDWAGGVSYGFFIIIKPKYKESKTLLEHELVHSHQFYRTFGFMSLLYWLSPNYRIKYELEAYHVQVKAKNYSDYIIKWVAKSLYNNYNTDKSKEELLKITQDYYLDAK